MGKELLGVLEQIERERGIDKEDLIQALEQSLVVAARKISKITETEPVEEEDISVHIDRETGEIKAQVSGKEIVSDTLARIAAQTAKQVIIQKIREAEKKVVYEDFKEKIGTLISGVVYRFERHGVIVDLFGKAEAIIPKRELSPLDKLKLGERIKAHCLEVKKSRSPQVIGSRRTALFVKKLFELEVPEIYEGIVEVKSVARDVGDRTKIAVYSKEDKVDCVGACVGMRGARVKNIVGELRGEKIDIVRYSDTIEEFIRASLSPAELSQIILNKEKARGLVIVNKDQLSLAIGKGGQNVRLASRLTGWELDIRSKEELKRDTEQMNKLKGVGKQTIENLKKAAYFSLKSIADESPKIIANIKGVGKQKAENIVNQAKKILESK